MMYLLFNEYGAIKDKQINEWIIQGSNNVNKIGVAIDGVDSTSFALVGICKLPNGEIITTAPVDEQAEIIDGVYGVVFSLSKDITALEGTLRINIQAINTTTDKIITSYTVYLCVNEGVDPGEIVMMTADQYQDLLSKIELDVQQDETILTFNALPLASNYSVGQVIYVHNEDVKKLYECISNDDTLEWHETFNFNNHYTKDEVNTMLNAKQDKLTRESLETAQLQYAVGFDAQGNLRKGAGGGSSIYTAGYGISISDFQISVDTTEIATKLELNAVAEIADGKNKGYVINTQSQITGTKDSDDNYTDVTAITGVVLTDLHVGDIIYIKELNVPDYWVSALVYSDDILQSVNLNKMETSKVDLTNYVDLTSAQTITGVKTFSSGIDLLNNYTVSSSATALLFKRSTTPLFDIYGATTTGYFNIGLLPYYNNQKDIGSSSNQWKDGYFAGQVYAQNTFNVINASDIVSNTLTQAQYDLITNGKPTLIKGTLLSFDNLILLPTWERGDYIYSYGSGKRNSIQDFSLFRINPNTKNIITVNENRFVNINSLYGVNGKTIPAYPTSNTSPQVLTIGANGGALSWETISSSSGLFVHNVSLPIVEDGADVNFSFVSKDSIAATTIAELSNKIRASICFGSYNTSGFYHFESPRYYNVFYSQQYGKYILKMYILNDSTGAYDITDTSSKTLGAAFTDTVIPY